MNSAHPSLYRWLSQSQRRSHCGAAAGAIMGFLVFAIGLGLVASPWWSTTLSANDRPLVAILGIVFGSVGAYVMLPERCPRLRSLAFLLFIGTFGVICAALMLAPFAPDLDGTYMIGGIRGFDAAGPIPWWARIVVGFFAVVCLGAAVLGAWGLVRGGTRPDRDDDK